MTFDQYHIKTMDVYIAVYSAAVSKGKNANDADEEARKAFDKFHLFFEGQDYITEVVK